MFFNVSRLFIDYRDTDRPNANLGVDDAENYGSVPTGFKYMYTPTPSMTIDDSSKLQEIRDASNVIDESYGSSLEGI